MAASHSDQQLLRTTSLNLATYLIGEGMTPTLEKVDGEQVKADHPQGAWVFKSTSTLRDLVEDFYNGEAQVEPEAYANRLKDTRREMFALLGIGS